MKVAGVKWDYDDRDDRRTQSSTGSGFRRRSSVLPALIFYATVWSTSGQLAAASIYGGGLIAACRSHSSTSLFRWAGPSGCCVVDHSGIFVLIAATYTPFLQRGWDDPFLFSMLVAIWLIAAAGIAMKCLLPGRFDRLAILLYLAMGWSGLLAAKSLFTALSATTLTLIVIGGVIYSVGVIFHVWERLRFQNAIWHGFVVTGAAVHYSAVLTCISSAAAS